MASIRTAWRAGSLLVSALWAAAVVASAFAGEPESRPPAIGDKVRVDFTRQVPGERDPIQVMIQRTGRLAAMDTASWTLEYRSWKLTSNDPPESAHIPIADFERVRVWKGRSANRALWRGAAWGLGVGAVVAVVAGVDHDNQPPDHRSNQALLWIPAGALLGAVTGAAIGTDEWQDYPVSRLFTAVEKKP